MSFHDILLPIVSTAVVILIFVITRARQQGDSTTVTNTQVQTMMKGMEDRREEEKERDKDIRGEMRQMNHNINDLTSAINLHNHMINESKSTISALQNKVYELELRLSHIARNGNKGAI